jgi:D-alanine-D-alanine ligase
MKTIAVVCGGYSKEEVVSLKSGEQIAQAIDANKFNVYKVLINKSGWSVLTENIQLTIDKNDFSFMLNGNKIFFDAVFMAIHGTPGEDGKLQSYFELLNIPLTTCNSFVSALTFNKFATKTYLKEYNILTAKDIMLRKNQAFVESEIINKLGLPIFVKPNNGGSSFGVTKVKAAGQLVEAIEKAFVEDTEIILEEFIEGQEFTCGAFVSTTENLILPITEIVSKTEFFDYKAKYEGLSDEITPARLSPEQTAECQSLTQEIYTILNCSGVVRIDFLMRNNKFYFMEVNTVPGMSKESIVPQQVRAFGLTVSDFYTKLIDDAILRSNR